LSSERCRVAGSSSLIGFPDFVVFGMAPVFPQPGAGR
jgi:hypothetical protein